MENVVGGSFFYVSACAMGVRATHSRQSANIAKQKDRTHLTTPITSCCSEVRCTCALRHAQFTSVEQAAEAGDNRTVKPIQWNHSQLSLLYSPEWRRIYQGYNTSTSNLKNPLHWHHRRQLATVRREMPPPPTVETEAQ